MLMLYKNQSYPVVYTAQNAQNCTVLYMYMCMCLCIMHCCMRCVAYVHGKS